MKYSTLLVALLLSLFCLSGCIGSTDTDTDVDTSQDEFALTDDNSSADVTPPTATSQLEEEPNASATTAPREPVLTPEQQAVAENLQYMNNVALSIRLLYPVFDYPIFYPIGDDTLNALRDMLLEINEESLSIQFDTYSITPCVYGYSVDITYPVDYQGSLYKVWFEVLPDDPETPRTTLVAAGPDGEVRYQGAGVDYTGINIGDDVIQFITYTY